MPGREIFGAALRILGVWFVYNGLSDALWLFMRMAHVVPSSASSSALEPLSLPDYHLVTDKVFVAFNLVLALVLLVFADRIVRLCYGPSPKASAPL